MLENTGILKMLAGAAGVTLVLGLGVSFGAVPRFGDETVQTASVAEVIEQAEVPARQPGDTAPQAEEAQPATTVAPVPTSAPSPATTPTTKPPAPRTTTTKAPATTKTTAAPAPTQSAAPAPTAAPVVSTKVPRRTPTPAEVQSTITQLKQKVGGLLMLVSPTPDQIAQAGDQICTAFDNGQTFAQVKATGLSMIPASISVTPDTVNWAVRTAVTLYCPGHANKLV